MSGAYCLQVSFELITWENLVSFTQQEVIHCEFRETQNENHEKLTNRPMHVHMSELQLEQRHFSPSVYY